MLFQRKLVGRHVAFTGKLACLTRSVAAELVQHHGGIFQTDVTRKTDILVVGLEGWPLQKDGRVSNKLEKAQKLKAKSGKPAVLSEEDWLDRLGMEKTTQQIHKDFSLARLCKLLKIPRDRMRAWMRWGWVQPVETREGVPYFNFRQVTGIKSLWELAQGGVTMQQLRRSLEQLSVWLPSLGSPLEQIQLLEQSNEVLWRLDEGQVVDSTGQLLLDYQEEDDQERAIAVPSPVSADALFEQGVVLEAEEQFEEAESAYRQALLLGGPKADVVYNLANCLYAQGQLHQAAERYRQAVEIDGTHAGAWNNLGNVLQEMGQAQEALDAYRAALKSDPQSAEAHYNLADALETMGQTIQARSHWKSYLRLEQSGPWADYARQALDAVS